jgi:Mg2+ and Co2+ transporter CorA
MNMPQAPSASPHDRPTPAVVRLVDALSHYSEIVAGRQAQVINALTIVATVFLPLSFLTGYFGMNFRILTADVQTTLWQFILLGLCPAASAGLSLLLIHRLQRRLGAGRMGQRPN